MNNIDSLRIDYSEAKRELLNANISYWVIRFFYCLAGATAWLLSVVFVVSIFADGVLNPFEWQGSQIVNGSVAASLTLVITACQFYLYKQGKSVGWTRAAMIALVVFSAGTEVASTLQKETDSMVRKSTESAEYNAAVSGISDAVKASVSADVSPALQRLFDRKADALAELNDCSRHKSKGQERVDKCVRYETKAYQKADGAIKSYQSQQKANTESNASLAEKMTEVAQDLGRSDENRLEIVKLLASPIQMLGVTSKTAHTLASTLISIFIIVVFEICFKILGKADSTAGKKRSKLARKVEELKAELSAALEQKENPTYAQNDTLNTTGLVGVSFPSSAPVTASLPVTKQPVTALQKGVTESHDEGTGTGYDGGTFMGFTSATKHPVTQSNSHSSPCNTRKNDVTRNNVSAGVTGQKTPSVTVQQDVCDAILKRGVTPTVRGMREYLKSIGEGISIRDRDNIAESLYPMLLDRKVIVKKSVKKGIKKATYEVNKLHPEYEEVK